MSLYVSAHGQAGCLRGLTARTSVTARLDWAGLLGEGGTIERVVSGSIVIGAVFPVIVKLTGK